MYRVLTCQHWHLQGRCRVSRGLTVFEMLKYCIWNVERSKYLNTLVLTYVLTSSHKAAPSLGCKVVVYSVNYNFCLNQISLNFYKINSEAAFPFSQSHTVVDACDIKKEVTLLYGLFLTLRCKLYQKGVKKSWSEFSYILCRGKKGDSIVMKLSNSWKL